MIGSPGACGQTNDHFAGNAQVEADAFRVRAGPTTCRAAANFVSDDPRGILALWKRQVSPDWKLRSQRRPPTQVADASCGFSVGTAAISRSNSCCLAVRARADQQRQIGHLVDRHAIENDPCRNRSARVGPALCHSAAGVRSTTSMTRVSGRRRDTRASLTQPNCSSRSRMPATSTKACGALSPPAELAARRSSSVTHSVDRRPIHVLEPDDLIAVHREARAPDHRTGGSPGLCRNIERDDHDDADREQEGGEHQSSELVCAPLVDGQPFCGLLGAFARAGAGSTAPDVRRTHWSASSISRSTSSP